VKHAEGKEGRLTKARRNSPFRAMLANKRLERDAHYVRAPQP